MADEANKADEINTDVSDETVAAEKVEDTTLLTDEVKESTLLTEEADKGDDPDAKDEDGKADDSKPEGAPETYEEFTFAEGHVADDKKVEAFVEIAKEADLTQEQAQALLNINGELISTHVASQQEAYTEVRKEWVATIKGDADIGGMKFNDSMKSAKQALKEYGSDELVNTLVTTGLGDNPEFVRFMVNVGRTLGEDTTTVEGAPGTREESIAKVLFPDHN